MECIERNLEKENTTSSTKKTTIERRQSERVKERERLREKDLAGQEVLLPGAVFQVLQRELLVRQLPHQDQLTRALPGKKSAEQSLDLEDLPVEVKLG